MDTQKSDEAENDKFQTIAPEKDNPVKRGNSKLGTLASRSFRKMKLREMSPVRVHRGILNLRSANFNKMRFDTYKKQFIINVFFIFPF